MDETPSVVEALKNWVYRTGVQGVSIREITAPRNDEFPDYLVAYELHLEPVSTLAMRVEIWISESEYIGIGLDSWQRIGQRIGVQTKSVRFCGGHEPIKVASASVEGLLNHVANGDISVCTLFIPRVGIIGTRLVANQSTIYDLEQRQYPCTGWLYPIEKGSIYKFGRLLAYERW